MVESTYELLYQWKMDGHPIHYLHMDNTGENKQLAEQINNTNWKLSLTFKFISAGIPQKNYLAELAFVTLCGRVCAMMQDTNIPQEQ